MNAKITLSHSDFHRYKIKGFSEALDFLNERAVLNCKVIRFYARTIAINLLYLHILSRRNTTLYIGGLLPPSCPTLPLKPDGSAMKLRISFGKTEYIQ